VLKTKLQKDRKVHGTHYIYKMFIKTLAAKSQISTINRLIYDIHTFKTTVIKTVGKGAV